LEHNDVERPPKGEGEGRTRSHKDRGEEREQDVDVIDSRENKVLMLSIVERMMV
jgi:hypothetical protein